MKKLSFSVGMMRNSRKLWWAVVLVGVFRSLPNLLVVPNNNFKGRNERHPDEDPESLLLCNSNNQLTCTTALRALQNGLLIFKLIREAGNISDATTAADYLLFIAVSGCHKLPITGIFSVILDVSTFSKPGIQSFLLLSSYEWPSRVPITVRMKALLRKIVWRAEISVTVAEPF